MDVIHSQNVGRGDLRPTSQIGHGDRLILPCQFAKTFFSLLGEIDFFDFFLNQALY
jgi:hypothetical protein